MRELPRALAAVLAAAALLVAAACGGGDGEEAAGPDAYREALGAVFADLGKDLNELIRSYPDVGESLAEPPGSRGTSFAARVGPYAEGVAKAYGDAAAAAAALEPPEEAREAHARLVAGFSGYGNQIRDLAASLEAQGSSALFELQRVLSGLQPSPSVREIQLASDDLAALGYGVRTDGE